MPTPTRELRITYGSTIVGAGSTIYLIDGPFTLAKDYETVTVSAEVVCVGTTVAEFLANCLALEAAFRVPRQFLEVRFGTNVHETFDPLIGVNTGFDAVPRIDKAGSPGDTSLSRRYRISVSVAVPADLAGQSGRRSSAVTFSRTDSNRGRLTITGQYTALTANNARAQFNASIDAFVTAVLAGFSGTWEGPFDRQEATNDTDKSLNFSRVYEELLYNQSVGALDDTNLRRQTLTVSHSIDAPGDSVLFGQTARRLRRVTVTYTAAVDRTVSTNLQSVYDGRVKPWLVANLRAFAGSSQVALVEQTPTFDPVENRISVTMTLLASGLSNLIAARVTTSEVERSGISLVPVWDGDRMSKVAFRGPGIITRTVTIVTTEFGGSSGASGGGSKGLARDATDRFFFSFGGAGGGSGGGGSDSSTSDYNVETLPEAGGVKEAAKSPDGGNLQRVLMSLEKSSTPLEIGNTDDDRFSVVEKTTVARFEYHVEPVDAKQVQTAIVAGGAAGAAAAGGAAGAAGFGGIAGGAGAAGGGAALGAVIAVLTQRPP